jgi:dynein heavy chain
MEVSVSVSEYCVKFFNEQKRKVYTTPKSYLDQLQLYNFILKQKLKEINSLKVKLSEGLSKLYNTNETVAKLKEEMKKLQPVLEEQSRKTERFLV